MMTTRIDWTAKMDAYLRRYYHRKSASHIAEKLGVTKSALLRRARSLEIQSNRAAGTALKAEYSEKDIAFIRDNIKALGAQDIAKKLNRTSEGVRRKANRLGVYISTRNKPLSHTEQQVLRRNIATKTYREIAKILNRGEEETRWHARRLGLSRRGRNAKKTRHIS